MTRVHSPQARLIPGEQAEKPVVVIDNIGGNCPVQAEGTVNGAPFYFRARGEHWSIEIGGGFVLEDAAKGIPATGFYLEEEYGDGPYAAGWMPEADARAFIDRAAGLYAEATTASSVGIAAGDEPKSSEPRNETQTQGGERE